MHRRQQFNKCRKSAAMRERSDTANSYSPSVRQCFITHSVSVTNEEIQSRLNKIKCSVNVRKLWELKTGNPVKKLFTNVLTRTNHLQEQRQLTRKCTWSTNSSFILSFLYLRGKTCSCLFLPEQCICHYCDFLYSLQLAMIYQVK